MRRRRLLLGAGVLAGVAVGLVALVVWPPAPPSVTVQDVRKAETLVLGQETGEHHTSGIWVHGSGYIDGEATISLQLGGTPYKVAKLAGKVDFTWGGDWYSETAEVRYEPAPARSGHVVLRYRFSQ
jgi:hypothetical protein